MGRGPAVSGVHAKREARGGVRAALLLLSKAKPGDVLVIIHGPSFAEFVAAQKFQDDVCNNAESTFRIPVVLAKVGVDWRLWRD
jgi:hypothetical protein